MRVALVSTYDERGGAARAAMRLHRALPSMGVESRMLVQRRFGDEPGVIGPRGGLKGGLPGVLAEWRPRLESIPVRSYKGRRASLFSPALLAERTASRIERLAPDVVHLHWLGFGFLRPESLPRVRRPVVWTMHDSWTFTGGCHVPGSCVRYRDHCGACPALGSDREDDLSRRVFQRKRRAWERLLQGPDAPRFVAPSRWLANAARRSALLRDASIDVIPNGLDLQVFRPGDRAAARARLDLPQDSCVVLFNALDPDPNKGFPTLRLSLRNIRDWQRSRTPRPDVILLVTGTRPGSPVPLDWSAEPGTSPMPRVKLAGPVSSEEAFAMHLAASDLVVLPSLQENQPNVVMEAMACARPVVAFDTSGVPELVAHGQTGILADLDSPEDLARGIISVFEDPDRARSMGERAREVAERFTIGATVRRYRDLYESLLDSRRAPAEAGPIPHRPS